MDTTWIDLTERTIELLSSLYNNTFPWTFENRSKRWMTLMLTPGAITEVNSTVQANTFLRAAEEGARLCRRFSLTKHYIYYFASLEWWCYSEHAVASLSQAISLPVFGGQVSLYMPLFYRWSRYIDHLGWMEVSVWFSNSGHTVTFLKNYE